MLGLLVVWALQHAHQALEDRWVAGLHGVDRLLGQVIAEYVLRVDLVHARRPACGRLLDVAPQPGQQPLMRRIIAIERATNWREEGGVIPLERHAREIAEEDGEVR